MTVVRLDAGRLAALAGELAELLVDSVDAGASLGFLAPLDPAQALAWWQERAGQVAEGRLVVWAVLDAGRVVGTVSLAHSDKPNSRHRAEVVKLMVHRETRGSGVGRRLLATAEEAAAASGLSLLHLDTETDSPAERFYDSAGWTRLGAIPDYAADPGGVLRPTSIYFKRLASPCPAVGEPAPPTR
ncbi:GNAT family N-acetyltransferase [Streptomyces sp. NPDC088387]|uniref:GNAT family N-acetyltransferase n=1 Tax=Streptomyces sp. NPDC088387 TaxID=3365859 RepID=UPI0037FA519D